MAVQQKRVAWGLGLFGIALGIAEMAAPRRVARLAGVDGHEALVRGFGAREIASGIPLLLAKRPAPWLWARVAGDVLDAGLLSKGMARRPTRNRALIAFLVVAPVVALDVIYAVKGSRKPSVANEPGESPVPEREPA